VISSPIDRLLVAVKRSAVNLGVGQCGEDLGERHGVLDRVGQHQRRAAAFVARQPPAIEQRVGLELGGAEDKLDPLAGLRVRDVVAAAFEAEDPSRATTLVVRSTTRYAVGGNDSSAAWSRCARTATISPCVPCTRWRAISSFQASQAMFACS
jgi:hypothetical protein